MSDFYIKLPSNGSKKEHPNNKSNSFKIRLPEPIRLGPDWKVGLTSISLPDTNGVLPKFMVAHVRSKGVMNPRLNLSSVPPTDLSMA